MPWGDSPSIVCDLTAISEGSDSGLWAVSAADGTIGLASPQGNSGSRWAEWVIEKGPGARLAVVTVSAAEEMTAVCLGKAEAPGNPGTWEASWPIHSPGELVPAAPTQILNCGLHWDRNCWFSGS